MNFDIIQQIKCVYNRLQDEESRRIFNERLLLFLDGDQTHFYNIVAGSKEVVRRPDGKPLFINLCRKLNNSPTILYGTGGLSAYAFELSKKLGVNILCFADSAPEKQMHPHLSLPVISPRELMEKHSHCNVVISNLNYEDEIVRFLLETGFPEGQIYYFPKRQNPVYFDLPFFQSRDHEIYVDAGCYDGENIKEFFNFCGGNCIKAYAMEPDPDNMARTMQSLSELPQDKLEYVKKARGARQHSFPS